MRMLMVALILLVLAWLVVATSLDRPAYAPAPKVGLQNSSVEQAEGEIQSMLIQAMLDSPELNQLPEYRHQERAYIMQLMHGDAYAQVDRLVRIRAGDRGREYWARAYLSQLKHAKSQGAKTCLLVAFPKMRAENVVRNQAILGKQQQKNTQHAIRQMIADYAKNGGRSKAISQLQMPPVNAQQAFELNLKQRFGEDISLLPPSETGNAMRQCDLVIAYYETALNLPIPERYHILDTLFSQHNNIFWF